MSQNRKIILITGGVRSGKSRYAQELAESYGDQVRYIASAEAKDQEMEKRIELHKKNRPNLWVTVEEPIHIADLFQQENSFSTHKVSLIDCITLWVSNLLLQKDEDEKEYWETERGLKMVEETIDYFITNIQSSSNYIILVTNEIGWGGIEMNPLGRVYQDFLGWTNQKIAKVADEVYLVVSGIPIQLKGRDDHDK